MVDLKSLMQTDIPFESFYSKIYKSPRLIGFIETLQFVILLIIVFVYNPFQISTKYPIATQVTIMLLGFVYVMLFYFLKEKITVEMNLPANSVQPKEEDFVLKIIGTLVFFVISVVVVKFVVGWIATSGVINLVRFFLAIMLFIGLLAILYILLAPMIKKIRTSGKLSFWLLVYNILMYLPCLLLSLIEYAKRDFNLTTRPVWILLGLEAVIIAIYLIIPKALHKVATMEGIQLINQPVYLYNEHSLGNFEQLYKSASEKGIREKRVGLLDDDMQLMDKNKIHNYHYALSAWFYINPQPPNTSSAYGKYTPILNYARKPIVEYNGSLNRLRVRTETKTDDMDTHPSPKKVKSRDNFGMTEIFMTDDVPLQKWNNIVINYDGGTMDVFFNGVLVGSKQGVTPYMTYENLYAGSQRGISGGICNVMYYPKTVSQGYVTTMYRLLRVKTYPVL